jgi:hypothetical protein
MVSKSRLEKLYEELGEGIDEDVAAFAELKRLTIKGAIWRKIADKDEYVDRLKMELDVVKHLKFSKYFLTYAKIMQVVGEYCLTGIARGSAASSLLAYVLNITQIDPIKYDLLFERFLTKTKKCLAPHTYIKTPCGSKQLKEIYVGDYVTTHNQEPQKVLYKEEEIHEEGYEIELEDGTKFDCSISHRWIVLRNGERIECEANELIEGDEFIKIV